MKIYMLNLPSSKDRRENIVRQFEKYDLNYEIETAVYGKDIPEEELHKIADMQHIARMSKYATVGAVGLCLTNKNVFKKIIDNNYDYAIVFEDDVNLQPDIHQFLDDIEKHIVPGEVILLYYKKLHSRPNGVFSNKGHVKVNETYSLYYPLNEKQFDMACAVIYTRAAAEGIIKHNTPVMVVTDAWDYFYQKGAITQMRCVYPTPVFPADFKSTIEYAEVRYGVFNKVLKFIDKYRLFPLYQILKIRRKNIRVNTEKYVFTDSPSVFNK